LTPLGHFLNKPRLRRAPLLYTCTYITALHLIKAAAESSVVGYKLMIISSTPASDTEDLNDDN
jgi:hypothetical protein